MRQSAIVRTLHVTNQSTRESSQFAFGASIVPGRDCSTLLNETVLVADRKWNATADGNSPYPVAFVCHLLTGGPSIFAAPVAGTDAEAQAAFSRAHLACLRENAALVVTLPPEDPSQPSAEFLLAPMMGFDLGVGRVPVFAVHEARQSAAEFLVRRVLLPRRLPIIFDLDETLIKARTINSLQTEVKLENLERRRQAVLQDPLLTAEQKAAKERELDDEYRPDGMMAIDCRCLGQFAASNNLVDPASGLIRQAKEVDVVLYLKGANGRETRAGAVKRPVVRMGDDIAFTRIKPSSYETNIVVRLRPYWSAVRAQLAGEVGPEGQRAMQPAPLGDTYVCTTATDPGYAHEVWRLLDPPGTLIAPIQWTDRILWGVTKKYLADSLRLTPPGPTSSPSKLSVMPLAVIVDDRTDVWEASARPQILEVAKWEPYQELARVRAAGMSWQDAPAGLEMLKVGGVLSVLHKRMFAAIDAMRDTLVAGRSVVRDLDLLDIANDYHVALAPPPWVSRLLPELMAEAPPLPRPLPTPADPRRQAPALAAPLPLPRDPREGAAAAAAAAGSAGAPPSVAAAVDHSVTNALLAQLLQSGFRPENIPPATAVAPTASTASTLPAGSAAVLASKESAAGTKRRREDVGLPEEDQDDYLEEHEPPQRRAAPAATPGAALQPISPEHPIVRLSQAAVEQRMELFYQREQQLGGSWAVAVHFGGKRTGWGAGASWQEAQQAAAEDALAKVAPPPVPSTGSGGATKAGPASSLQRPVGRARGGRGAGGSSGKYLPHISDAQKTLRKAYPKPNFVSHEVLSKEGGAGVDLRTTLHIVNEEDEDIVSKVSGRGQGNNFNMAKNAAALEILEKLGYKGDAP